MAIFCDARFITGCIITTQKVFWFDNTILLKHFMACLEPTVSVGD